MNTTMTNPHANGRKRPSLSEQINRLDCMLDGLNDAVADAVKAAVGAAVKDAVQSVLKEVLTNPVLLAKLQPPMATVAEPAPDRETQPAKPRSSDWWQRARAYGKGLGEACQESMQRLRTYVSGLWQKATPTP
jgi:hypothetical protein